MEEETVRLSCEQLFELVWERPLSRLADELGVSDVGLAKMCTRLEVPRPTLLLASHLDAVFDAGFITLVGDGAVLVSDALPNEARTILGLEQPLTVRGLHREHERYLPWHRTKVFQAGPGVLSRV